MNIIQLGNLRKDKGFKNPQCGRVYSVDGCSPTINTCQGGQREPMILTENENNPEELRIRKLTPREFWRLQGFEDSDFDKAKNCGMSDSRLYMQAGNSICVDVLYYIYKELYKAMPYLFDNLKVSSFFSGIGAMEKALDRLYDDINNENFSLKRQINY